MPPAPARSIQITPRQKGAVARVSAVDFQNLPDDHVEEIYTALAKHPVLEFPKSGLTRDQQLDLTRRLCARAGARADDVEITEITNQGEYGDYELDWHADGYFKETGPKIGILNAVTLPSTAVNTRFCDMAGLWRDLPQDLQAELRGKTICTDSVYTQYGRPRGPDQPTGDFRQWPHIEHPIVHVDQETKREALFLGARKWSFVKEMEQPRDVDILKTLWERVDSGDYVFEADWQPGMMVMWRNDLVLHFKPKGNSEPRLLHRTSVLGSALVPSIAH